MILQLIRGGGAGMRSCEGAGFPASRSRHPLEVTITYGVAMMDALCDDPTLDDLPLGRRLAQARQRAGLTQAALGDLVGAPKNSISEWERGLREPRIGVILRIADALGLTVDQLIRGDLEAIAGEVGDELLEERLERIGSALGNAAEVLRRAAQQAALGASPFDEIVDALAEVRAAERALAGEEEDCED